MSGAWQAPLWCVAPTGLDNGGPPATAPRRLPRKARTSRAMLLVRFGPTKHQERGPRPVEPHRRDYLFRAERRGGEQPMGSCLDQTRPRRTARVAAAVLES